MAVECPKCHTQNLENSRFCSKCAIPLPSPEEISAFSTKTLEKTIVKLARGTVFADRFEIIEELGKGGMGNVYRVVDTQIDEEVALKVIRPEIATDKNTIERFRNELKFSRRIAHKNVCKMYDFGEEKGTHYITMEYVPGKNLKSMVRMSGQLSMGTAVNISKQICEGLVEAHRLGVVHRDLKPGNIMIDRNGNARIMDFGIARSLKAKSLTRAGVMIGTPEYISPEQVEGKQADRRSDIYSLGIILYEMVAGRLPFDGGTPLSIAVKHKTETPRDPAKFNPQIPAELSRMILQCIQKEKKKRYQETDKLLRELQRIEEGLSTIERIIPKRKTTVLNGKGAAFWRDWKIAAALFVLVVVVGIAIISVKKEAPALPSKKKMLVVLPFENLGSFEDEYFAEGLTEELTTRLAALHGLGVISRTSSKQYKSTTKTVKQIGEELGVDYLLEGTVRWDRSQAGKGVVRVMPQLIRVSDDTRLWYERYDRVIEDIFEVQSEIAEQVINQLDLTLLEPEREALRAHPTDNMEAYDHYLRGREHAGLGWNNSDPKEFDKAVELLEKAVELDPRFTFAYITLSVTNQWIYTNGFDRTDERLVKAREAVYRALELEPDLPEAKLTLGLLYYRGYQDYDRALEIFKSVQKARPNLPYTYLGYIQRRMGRWEESTANLEKSFKLNPRSSDLAYQIGGSYMYMRKYQEAEEWYDLALSVEPNYYFPQLAKAEIAYLSRGDIDEARALLGKLPQHRLTDYRWYTLEMLAGDYQQVQRRLGSSSYDSFVASSIYIPVDLAYASAYFAMKEVSLMKNHAESVRLVLGKAMEERPADPRFHAAIGLAYAYLGRKEEAIREGNRAVQLYPVSRDAYDGPQYIWNLAIIYTVIGEYEEAIGQLEYLLSTHAGHLISVPLLRIDPMWEPLRKHPRFQRLLKQN